MSFLRLLHSASWTSFGEKKNCASRSIRSCQYPMTAQQPWHQYCLHFDTLTSRWDSERHTGEHWPGNYPHAWTWAFAWRPSGCESRSPPSSPGGRTQRWYALWCTSGRARNPPPSWISWLPVRGDKTEKRTWASVPSHHSRFKQVTLLESIFDGQSPQL